MTLGEIRQQVVVTYGGTVESAIAAAAWELGISHPALRANLYGQRHSLAPEQIDRLARLIELRFTDLLGLLTEREREVATIIQGGA